MGFLNKSQEEDDELPGSGLHVDLDTRRCPECRRETLPWQDVCPDCGIAPVSPSELPASGFALPAHLLEDPADDLTADTDTATDARDDDSDTDAEPDA